MSEGLTRVALPPDLLASDRRILLAALAARGHAPADDPAEAEGLLLAGAALTAERLDGLARLRGVVRYAAGRHDVGAEPGLCAERAIRYRRVSGASAGATAEHAVALMLALARGLDSHRLTPGGGPWRQGDAVEAGLRGLAGRRIGLVGPGAVGRATARLLAPFGARLAYAGRRRLPADEERRLGLAFAEIDELVDGSEILSLHVRQAGPDPRPVLDAPRVARLRRGAIVINTGDGRSVDLDALGARVARGEVLAGLDVFPVEPWTAPLPASGLIATPHIGGRGREVAEALFAAAAAALDTPEAAAGPAPEPRWPGMWAGPLVRDLAARLGPARPLRGHAATLAPGGVEGLCAAADALSALGCATVRIDREAPDARVALDGGPAVRLELRADPDPASTGALPSLRWLVERRWLDHAVWDRLLPGAGRGALSGRRLLVRGYGPRGRTVAWRARAFGMRVTIAAEEPLARLTAVMDGFEAPESAAEPDVDARDGLDVAPSLDAAGADLLDAVSAAGCALLCLDPDAADAALTGALLRRWAAA